MQNLTMSENEEGGVNPPSPDEIKKDLEELFRDKYGANINMVIGDDPAGIDLLEKMDAGEQLGETEQDNESQKEIKMENLRQFKMSPKEVKSYLDRFVIKQDEAKKALSIAICDHYNHVRRCLEDPEADDMHYYKQNILLMGPTGVGKTYLIKLISELLGVPYVKADATRFTEIGYVGSNVDDLCKDLVTKAGGDISLAQYGIIFLDEADKLASGTGGANGKEVGSRGVQFGLLKLMEDTEVNLTSPHDMASQIQSLMEFQKNGKVEPKLLNTKHVLFIVSGAFTGLEDIVSKRLKMRTIGLTKGTEDKSVLSKIYKNATTGDFISYGLEAEFIGRLPVRVSCDELSAEDLTKVLGESEESLILQYVDSFKGHGIDVRFTTCAISEIAKLAFGEKTGARGLMTVMEKILREYKYELPSSSIDTIQINSEIIRNPDVELTKLLNSFDQVPPQVPIQ